MEPPTPVLRREIIIICLAGALGSGLAAVPAWRASAATDLFVDSGQRLGNEATWGVALGDVDRDGDLDAVAANFDAGAFVWLNDGSGHFTDSGQRLETGLYESAVLVDLDGDGAVDLLLGSWDFPLAVWWNSGAGTFSKGVLPSAAGRCLALAAGDLNGDGRPDIFLGQHFADVVLLNAGNRMFVDSGQRLGAQATGGVAIGDMDGDGDLDVLAAGWDEVGRVWANNGAGFFTARCSIDVVSLHVHAADLADADGDGDLDAFFALAAPECCRGVWLNDGTGVLTPTAYDLGSDLRAGHGIAVVDFDGDGVNDIVQALGAAVTPLPSRVWLGSAGAGYVDTGLRIGDAFAGAVDAGDLDGDGDLDLVFACLSLPTPGWDYQPSPNLVWLNTSNNQSTAVGGEAPAADRPLLAEPNPFNPRTTIRFDLAATVPARLAIYDLAGRLVRTLVDGALPRGSQRIVWDGMDDAGRSLPSGSYLARLAAGQESRTTRLSLVK